MFTERRLEQRLEVVAQRLGVGEAEHAALALERVDASSEVGGGFVCDAGAAERLGLSSDSQVLEFRQATLAAGDPGGEQFGVGGFTRGGFEAFRGTLARAYGLDEAGERGRNVVDLSKHDLVGEVSRGQRLLGHVGHALRTGVCGELPQQLAKGDEALEIRRVGECGRLCGGLDRGLEPHAVTPSVEGLRWPHARRAARTAVRTRIGGCGAGMKTLCTPAVASPAIGALARAVNARHEHGRARCGRLDSKVEELPVARR